MFVRPRNRSLRIIGAAAAGLVVLLANAQAASLPSVVKYTCYVTTVSGGALVPSCDYSKGNQTVGSYVFYVRGLCVAPGPNCKPMKETIKTQMPPTSALSFSCPAPGVSFSFWGGSSADSNGLGYLWASGYANSDVSSVSGGSSRDCHGVFTYYGPSSWRGTCI